MYTKEEIAAILKYENAKRDICNTVSNCRNCPLKPCSVPPDDHISTYILDEIKTIESLRKAVNMFTEKETAAIIRYENARRDICKASSCDNCELRLCNCPPEDYHDIYITEDIKAVENWNDKTTD